MHGRLQLLNVYFHLIFTFIYKIYIYIYNVPRNSQIVETVVS